MKARFSALLLLPGTVLLGAVAGGTNGAALALACWAALVAISTGVHLIASSLRSAQRARFGLSAEYSDSSVPPAVPPHITR